MRKILFFIIFVFVTMSLYAGKIFSVKYANQAKKKIFFVKYANQADVKIYFVKYQNQAGWRNNSKKHFFF